MTEQQLQEQMALQNVKKVTVNEEIFDDNWDAFLLELDLDLEEHIVDELSGGDGEAVNGLFCVSQEKFHTFVERGLRNISGAP